MAAGRRHRVAAAAAGPVHRDRPGAHRHARAGAGRERRADRRDRGPPGDARAGGHDRARHRVPGVQALNIDYGDRDSLGLFQQRPSQGWGTRRSPRPGLLHQRVLRRAGAGRRLRGDAGHRRRAGGAALRRSRTRTPTTRRTPGCSQRPDRPVLAGVPLHGDRRPATRPRRTSTRRASPGVRPSCATTSRPRSAPSPSAGSPRAGSVTATCEGSAHYDGRAIDVFFRPGVRGEQAGWLGAGPLPRGPGRPARRTDRHLRRPDLDRGPAIGLGWRRYAPDTSGRDAEAAAILEHRDHVHVDVYPRGERPSTHPNGLCRGSSGQTCQNRGTPGQGRSYRERVRPVGGPGTRP